MNILTICHDHPEFTAGGTEFVAHDLTRALDAVPGVQARFLAATSSLTHPEAAPGSLHALGGDFLLRTGNYDIFSMRRHDGTDWIHALDWLLSEVKPDVAHLHGLDRIGAEVLPLLRRLRPDLRIVLTLHDHQLICANDGLLIRRQGGLCHRPSTEACQQCFPDLGAGRHALRKAHLLNLLTLVDAFVAPSHAVVHRFAAWGLDHGRVVVLPNAVPAMVDHTPDSTRKRRNRFAFFGNMAQHKGTHILLDAARRLATQEADLSISLHGQLNHPSEAALRKFDNALTEAGAIASHLGPYDRSEIGALMRHTDWVVVPSLWEENAPLVVLEAHRAGRPVISTALGGLRELVRDGIDGLHVPRGNAAALAHTLHLASADPDLWTRLAANIRQPMTPEDHARQHLALYSTLQERVAA